MENNQSGVSSTWSNPNSENSGSIIPTNTYQTADGEDCRDFKSTITVDGKTEAALGRTCRRPDGSWLIVQCYQ
jgi:surface antigen